MKENQNNNNKNQNKQRQTNNNNKTKQKKGKKKNLHNKKNPPLLQTTETPHSKFWLAEIQLLPNGHN